MFGRKRWPNDDKWEYYTVLDNGVKIPIVPKPNFYELGENDIVKLIKKHFDLRPGLIIQNLKLKRPIYAKTASYGHFGRDDPDFTWENTNLAPVLREEAGI